MIEALAEKVAGLLSPEPNTGCVLWCGSVDSWGYPVIYFEGRLRLVSRLILGLERGDPHALHRCDMPICLNDRHLYEGTDADNARDCIARRRHHSFTITHCPAGHPYDEANTYLARGRRNCRACNRAAQSQKRQQPQ